MSRFIFAGVFKHYRARLLRRHPSGQGLVEFALAIPLLLTLVLGIIEGGRLLFIYSSVAAASREASRYGAAEDNFTDCAGIVAAAERIGSFAGVSDANISIRYDDGTGALTKIGCEVPAVNQCPVANLELEDRVIVNVSVEYKPIVPLVNIPSLCIESQNARTVVTNLVMANDISAGGGGGGGGGPAATSVHVSDLDGVSDKKTNNWAASVTIQVHDDLEANVPAALVTGTWSTGATGSCSTDINGVCTMSVDKLDKDLALVTFTVTGVSSSEPYSATSNYDPDGSSSGTQVTINHH